MTPGGYAWWYVDALSDDGRSGLSVIAMIGNVFSPYYYWAGRRDPENHCAVNVSLYGARAKRWSMTERGRGVLERDAANLRIGPSALAFERDRLTIDLDETAAPLPSRIRGRIVLHPAGINQRSYRLDGTGRHCWRPIAPCARVEVALQSPAQSWSGAGYFDTNAGDEPLEAGFSRWDWSRASLRQGAAVLYNVTRRDRTVAGLALRFSPSGDVEDFAAPANTPLPPTGWGIARATQADGRQAHVVKTLEDAPFYARSLLSTHLLGEPAMAMHESLSLDRFKAPWVKLLLPFKMPRALW